MGLWINKSGEFMATYIIGDIHGCYDELCAMLEKINFSADDTLVCVGDYIDRGMQSYEMLCWFENKSENIITIRGNHEEEFITNVDILLGMDAKEELETDFLSNEDSRALYDTTMYFIRKTAPEVLLFFDTYKTIKKLLFENNCTIDDLKRWAEIIRQMPYYSETNVSGRNYIVVHAGFTENGSDKEKKDFYLYAREENLENGGKEHTTIIAGHTPTIVEDEFAFNDGNVFKYNDEQHDCTFYDIDCGCVFRREYDNARLACIRLEDEQVFYL